MSIRVRKITLQVHTETLDDEGRPIGEGMLTNGSNEPATFTVYAHQLAEVETRVHALAAAAKPESE